jgi:hypothetical protein
MGNERGQATLETALLLPVLALLIAALVQVALLGVDQIRLWHAVREGARTAAVTAEKSRIERAVERSGLDGVKVSVSPRPAYRRAGRPVTVSITYSPRWTVPLVDRMLGAEPMEASASMRIEQP